MRKSLGSMAGMALAFAALAESGMEANRALEFEHKKKETRGYENTTLSKLQLKRRAKEKRAKLARKINR